MTLHNCLPTHGTISPHSFVQAACELTFVLQLSCSIIVNSRHSDIRDFFHRNSLNLHKSGAKWVTPKVGFTSYLINKHKFRWNYQTRFYLSTENTMNKIRDPSKSETSSSSESDDDEYASSEYSKPSSSKSKSQMEYIQQFLRKMGLSHNDEEDSKTPQVLKTVDFNGIIDHWKAQGFKKIVTMAGAGISTCKFAIFLTIDNRKLFRTWIVSCSGWHSRFSISRNRTLSQSTEIQFTTSYCYFRNQLLSKESTTIFCTS